MPPFTPLGRALAGLIGQALHLTDILSRLWNGGEDPRLPPPIRRRPRAAADRVQRALAWSIALSRTLAGDSAYIRRAIPLCAPPPVRPRPARAHPPRAHPPCAQSARPRPAPRPPTQARRDAAQFRYRARIFATRPTGRIAQRLAGTLGLTPGHERWPTELIALTRTPAEVCALVQAAEANEVCALVQAAEANPAQAPHAAPYALIRPAPPIPSPPNIRAPLCPPRARCPPS